MRIKIQDSDSKLILSYYIGPRTMASTYKFVRDLSERTKASTRSLVILRGYIGAVEEWFGGTIFRNSERFTDVARRAQSCTAAAAPQKPAADTEWSALVHPATQAH